MSEIGIIKILLLLEVNGLFLIVNQILTYPQTSDISLTFVGYTIVDHSNVVGASPVRVAPTTSWFSTKHLASMVWAKTTVRREDRHMSFGISSDLCESFRRQF